MSEQTHEEQFDVLVDKVSEAVYDAYMQAAVEYREHGSRPPWSLVRDSKKEVIKDNVRKALIHSMNDANAQAEEKQ